LGYFPRRRLFVPSNSAYFLAAFCRRWLSHDVFALADCRLKARNILISILLRYRMSTATASAEPPLTEARRDLGAGRDAAMRKEI
jgi:hypothetical protein